MTDIERPYPSRLVLRPDPAAHGRNWLAGRRLVIAQLTGLALPWVAVSARTRGA